MSVSISVDATLNEDQFAAFVDELAASDTGREAIVALLRESHPVYEHRASAAIVRMRGWLLLTLARLGVSESDLIYVVEELDNGHDPYLVAAAARALRSYTAANASHVPMVRAAFESIRYDDDALSLTEYGGYAVAAEQITTAVRELQTTLEWLEARRVEPIRGHCCCSGKAPTEAASPAVTATSAAFCESAVFEDHDGNTIGFPQFLRGKPTIVVFFYTRCTNPKKCSLTITKLGQLQTLLRERGLADDIRTAAITYDPAFDLPERLRGYALNRGVQLDADHRILRAIEHWSAVRDYFDLGVNFTGSIVNRHRVELFVLDVQGKVAASFERLQWREEEVMEQAVRLLK